MPDGTTALLILTVAVALGFDFTNGFHDTANAVATAIGTRRSHRIAIIPSAILNLVGAVIATQVLHEGGQHRGWPAGGQGRGGPAVHRGGTGRRHRLEPGHLVLRPAVELVARPDWRAFRDGRQRHMASARSRWTKLWPTIVALVTSPVAGSWALHPDGGPRQPAARCPPQSHQPAFRRLQILSSAFRSFSHGANDSQKTMAVIALALVSTHHLAKFAVPFWVVLAARRRHRPGGRTPGAGASSAPWAPASSGLNPSTALSPETIGAAVIS